MNAETSRSAPSPGAAFHIRPEQMSALLDTAVFFSSFLTGLTYCHIKMPAKMQRINLKRRPEIAYELNNQNSVQIYNPINGLCQYLK